MVGSGFQVIAKIGDSQWSEPAFLPPFTCSLPCCKIVNSMVEALRFWYLGKTLICITTELWKAGLWMGWDGQSYCSRLLVDRSRILAYISASDYWSYCWKRKESTQELLMEPHYTDCDSAWWIPYAQNSGICWMPPPHCCFSLVLIIIS